VSREEVVDGMTFYPQTCEVTLNYFPNDIPEHARKALGKAAWKYATHDPLPSVIGAVVERTHRVTISDGKDIVAKRRSILGPDYDI
jgi:biotin synthase-related radical SAM superfamily protein